MTSDAERKALKFKEPLVGSAKLPSRDTNGHLYVFVLLAIIFYLPYYIPQRPVASDSYLFGYNNRAAVILLLAFSAGAAIWGKGVRSRTPPGRPA